MEQQTMSQEDLQVVAFEIIVHSGDARSLIHQALSLMKQGEFSQAQCQLDEANKNLLEAHKSQTSLLKDYACGTVINMEIIMVHAQDHLMSTMLLHEIALEFLALHQKIAEQV
ncbi:PTS cellobiose transporter subunit IIA [Lonepinella koalarum]|uniref:PTS system cellobiose-specific IIA component n=1 Tax=Lonepinella koalarum TaxID=53417 RepID=A0A4R1L2Z6_9PAST|nr:PTS cellobiose transporter subunit IIA [Lonepinella koalarum]TCK71380.1 PTS system cellobiose-specific IIA component [Lonepinella koalarum]